MFNDAIFAARIKKDAKSTLLTRNIDNTLYITNRHYLAAMPVDALAALPKTAAALLAAFGEQWVSLDKNVQTSNGSRPGECTVDMTKIMPADWDAGHASALTYNGADTRYRIITGPNGLVLINDDYAMLADSPVGAVGVRSDFTVYYDDTCRLLVFRFRGVETVMADIKQVLAATTKTASAVAAV